VSSSVMDAAIGRAANKPTARARARRKILVTMVKFIN
jgi:hypothetical protein